MSKQSDLGSFFSSENKSYTSLKNKIALIDKAEKEGKNIRELEMVLFRSKDVEEIHDVLGDKVVPDFVKVFFRSKKFYNLFCKHFKVNAYVENNVHRIESLIFFLLLLEKGIITKEEHGSSVLFKFNVKEAILETGEFND